MTISRRVDTIGVVPFPSFAQNASDEPGAFVDGAFLYQNDKCPDWELENPDPAWPAEAWMGAHLKTRRVQPYAMSDDYLTN